MAKNRNCGKLKRMAEWIQRSSFLFCGTEARIENTWIGGNVLDVDHFHALDWTITGRSWYVSSIGVGTIRQNATWIFGTFHELQPLCQQYFSVVARLSTPARIWNCTFLFLSSMMTPPLLFWHAALSQAGHRWENFFWASPVFWRLEEKGTSWRRWWANCDKKFPANSAPGILFLITTHKTTKKSSVCTRVHHDNC